MKKKQFWLAILSVIGLVDASFLTYEHFANTIPPCTAHSWFADCGKVLDSSYATIFGIPLAILGIIYYGLIFLSTIYTLISTKRNSKYFLLLITPAGFLASLYFVYLQLFVIHAICLYCMVSALISTSILILSYATFTHERHKLMIEIIGFLYQNFLKKIFFLIDPEKMHHIMTDRGELLGSFTLTKKVTNIVFDQKYHSLNQTLHEIHFTNPIGLAAGFDYEGKLTQILSDVGFGFQTVGTITNMPYDGNPRPMLGRLPQSKSLMVNKGFKNLGVDVMVEKLSQYSFEIPVGISIGRTNLRSLKTQKDSIHDIIQTFTRFENSTVTNSYYELNISCPNLFGDITFYPPKNLAELLDEVQKLRIKKPIFIKMPIEKSNEDVLEMLEVIANHDIDGVIFGNLQKNRNHPALIQNEVQKFPTGNFSGKPTFERSNELIQLTYKHYKKHLTIIGCGGIFDGADAYSKILLGASLVQLITGMIYQGPQLIAQIRWHLAEQLKKDNFKSITQAIGAQNK